MVFVDTGAWYATVIAGDSRHVAVHAWLRGKPLPLLTTDYIIDETLTLLRARGKRARSLTLGRRFFDLDECMIHHVDETDLRRAWELFRDQPQRDWSFTDCTSRAVIQRLHIKYILTFDHHFRQFGGLTIIPNGQP